MVLAHKRLLLRSLVGGSHMIRPGSIVCAAKLRLHHALRISHHVLMVTRIILGKILLPLDFLVLLVACLALVLCILFRQRWTSLTRFAPELARLTWGRCFGLKL